MSAEKLDAINARHATEFANVTREETVALLRRNGATAVQTYRVLSESQLDRSVKLMLGSQPSSVGRLIERLAIGEITRHGEEILRAITA